MTKGISEPVLSFVDTVLKEWNTGRFEVKRAERSFDEKLMVMEERYSLEDNLLERGFKFSLESIYMRSGIITTKLRETYSWDLHYGHRGVDISFLTDKEWEYLHDKLFLRYQKSESTLSRMKTRKERRENREYVKSLYCK